MRSSARIALPSVLAILSLATSLFAQAQVKQPAVKTPGGTVSGRITIKDKPAPGVLVVLRKTQSNPWEALMKAVTDQNGVYRITNVAPGSYAVVPTTPAYVPADAAGRSSVVIAEDDNIENINFSLVRGGVITGKVTDGEGRPVVQHNVEIYRPEMFDNRAMPQQPQSQQQQPRQPIFPARNAQTDDRGIYRAYGLAPGRYIVSAGRNENGMNMFSISPITYAQVFHPDAKDPAKATVIEVSEASEATNVDIVLGPTLQLFTVSGRVINSDNGAPVTLLRFGLHRLVGDRVEYVSNIANSNARGEFTVEGLMPGKYGVYLFTDPSSELRAERTTFDVIDQDVTGLTIKLAKGGTITGVVILESEDKTAHKKMLEMRLQGHVETYAGMSTASLSPIGPDGSFRLTGVPAGMTRFNILPQGRYLPTAFVIARLERDGVVLPAIEIKEGETIAGVKVFVRYGTASIRGVVTFENGTLPQGSRVMVRLSKPGEPLPYNRQAEVDARGHFFIDNLPTGIYELKATIYGRHPRTLEQKKDVSVTDGAATNVMFTIDLSTLANQ